MWGRFEGLKKCGRIILVRTVFFIVFVIIRSGAMSSGTIQCGTMLSAQDFSEGIMRMIERINEDGSKDAESLVAYLEYLMQHPADINNATREELDQIPFMTPFMVESIISYRREYGLVISWAELSLLHGFDENIVKEIRPFVFLGQKRDISGDSAALNDRSRDSILSGFYGTGRKYEKQIKHRLILRSRTKLSSEGKLHENREDTVAGERGNNAISNGEYDDENGKGSGYGKDDGKSNIGKSQNSGGLPLSIYTRYRMDCGKKAALGFTLESDIGEKQFPDFCSFYLNVNEIPLSKNGFARIRSIVAGDYSLRFGQGLILWNSFSFSGISSPSSIIKTGGKIIPYASSDENNFFRGAALDLVIGNHIETSLFFSASQLDAKVVGNAFYTLPKDGIHVNKKSLAAKNALTEYLAGGNLTFRQDCFRIGVTAVAYRYNKQDCRRTSYYNRHLRYEGWWCDVSADFLYSYNGIRVFGEFALDRKASFGGLAGVIAPIASAVELSVLCRYYDPAFIAKHSGAVSASTYCNNEIGASTILKWSPLRKLTFHLYAGYIRHPCSRFGVKGASDRWNIALDCDWNVTKHHSLSLRGRYEADNGKALSRYRCRLGYIFDSLIGFSAVTRLEASYIGGDSSGYLAYEELIYKTPSERFRCAVRGTVFFINGWDARIYCCERDLPQSFSVPAYYGRGAGLYAVATYKPASCIGISLKCSGNMFFDKSEKSIKLGLHINLLF